jgi:hypothetical protein
MGSQTRERCSWLGKKREDTGIDGRRLLIWILKKWDGEVWTGLILLWIGTGSGHLLVNAVMKRQAP